VSLVSTQPEVAPPPGVRDEVAQLRVFLFALFFIFGGITSLNDVIIPKLKELFTLSYAQAMLVQSAFFAAYLIVSLPAAALVRRVGYMRTAIVGLLTMAAGCVVFVPASFSSLFGMFLLAIFILATGITIVQVVANPLVSMTGPPATVHSRLTFAQAFNALGTTIFPYIGSLLILSSLQTVDPAGLAREALDAYRETETGVIAYTYVGLAAVTLLVAGAVWALRNRFSETRSAETAAAPGSALRAFGLLARPRFRFGALCIFLYVGAEVALGSLIVNYLMQPEVLGFDELSAGKSVPLYWGGAMIGRFIGAYLLRVRSPGKVLACAAGAAVLLLTISGQSGGALSGYSLLAVGLCNSIMFPTIFSLASEGLGPRAADGSGIICVAIVGGAIVPLITGHAADVMGLQAALVVPACCYAVILAFGLYARRALDAT